MKSLAVIGGIALTTLVGFSTAADIGCYVPGECVGTYTNIGVADDESDCLELCKVHGGCYFWSFYPNTMACRGMATCTVDSASECVALGCVSGDKDCATIQCDVPGQCKGQLAGFDTTSTRDACVFACQDDDACQWWSWDSSTGFCVMSATCDVLDSSCTTCVSGQRGCEINVEPPTEENLDYVLITGGYDSDEGRHADGELIDISGENVHCDYPADFPYAIEEHVGFNQNGKAFVCGGYGDDDGDTTSQVLNKCYSYSRAAAWTAESNMPAPRARSASLVWEDGNVWITGGRSETPASAILSSTIVMNDQGIFSTGTELPDDMEFHCMVRISETIAVIAGGYNYQNSHSRNAWYYNYLHDNFTELPDMNDGRYGHTCELVRSSRGAEVVVAGGGLDRQSVDVLDLASMSWRVGTPLPNLTAWAKSVPYGDSFLIMGGGDGSGNYYDSIYEYKAENETWVERPEKMHHGKYDFSAVLMDRADIDCTVGTTVSEGNTTTTAMPN